MLQSPSNEITASPAAPGEQETGAALPSRKTAARISLHSCVAALMVLDFLAFALAGSLAALGPPEFQLISLNFEDWRVQAIIFAACSHLIWARLFGLYRVKSILRRSHALRRLPLSIIATFCLLLVIAVAGKSAQNYSENLVLLLGWAQFRAYFGDSLDFFRNPFARHEERRLRGAGAFRRDVLRPDRGK